MRALIQRVIDAAVLIEETVHAEIGQGLLVFLGIEDADTPNDAAYLADKCTGLRIFSDQNDKMNLSLSDIHGELLIVSQFTLYGDCRKGRRPNFMRAASPESANALYEQFIDCCRATGIPTCTGQFGADMQVRLTNDGPVTIWIDTAEMKKTEE